MPDTVGILGLGQAARPGIPEPRRWSTNACHELAFITS